MSVVVFKIVSVNCGIDIKGEDVAVGLQVNQVIPKQLGNVSVRQYLSRSLNSDQKSSPAQRKSCPEISLRLETGPSAKRYSPLAAENGFLQCQVADFGSEFLTSTLANIHHFIDDDSVPEVMPMKIRVQKAKLHLQDDSPKNNNSDPEPEPIVLNIQDLLVERYDDGSFCIKGNGDTSTDTSTNLKELKEIPALISDSTKSIQHRSTQTLCDSPAPPQQLDVRGGSRDRKTPVISMEQVRYPSASLEGPSSDVLIIVLDVDLGFTLKLLSSFSVSTMGIVAPNRSTDGSDGGKVGSHGARFVLVLAYMDHGLNRTL
ncbi:hypothetical protein GDO81_010995 [Engystomops pustulosus]|uniref:Uncharacterized protein n=1 Tax=Engystomops pustulosus TaxID=76066 RepID=A0AAV7C5K0_ENGPU|nr:hypothetical protein GDO81_010995 [Engystomops pustulosus]